MIIAEKNQQSSSTEEETNDIKQLSNSDKSKTKLNVKEKKEITENNSLNYFEETKSLKYDSSYKAVLSDKQNNILRKSSTLSTNISQNETGFDNLSPQKSGKDNSSSSLENIGRERFYSTPISNYYDGTDNYFKGLYPDKNDYQKSNNYLEKKIFFRDHYPSVDLNKINKEKQKCLSLEEISKNQPSTPQIIPYTQSPKNLGKIEFPVYFFGYCGIDCKL